MKRLLLFFFFIILTMHSNGQTGFIKLVGDTFSTSISKVLTLSSAYVYVGDFASGWCSHQSVEYSDHILL